MVRAFLIALVASASASASADIEGEVKGEVNRLRKLVSQADWKEAAAAARSVDAIVAQQAPLDVVDGKLLAAPADGLGMYRAAPGGVIRGGEIFLYAQVRNHGVRKLLAGYELHLVSDLLVLDPAGNELVRDEAFGESRFTARVPHRDTFVNVALRAEGLPKGKYTMRLVIHDRIGNKQGTVDIPVTMP